MKSHELLCHSEHFQCNSCKHISPLDQPEEFKLHLFKHECRKHECIRCGFTSPTLKSLEAHFKSEGSDGSVNQNKFLLLLGNIFMAEVEINCLFEALFWAKI